MRDNTHPSTIEVVVLLSLTLSAGLLFYHFFGELVWKKTTPAAPASEKSETPPTPGNGVKPTPENMAMPPTNTTMPPPNAGLPAANMTSPPAEENAMTKGTPEAQPSKQTK